jgi:hypothetical protein
MQPIFKAKTLSGKEIVATNIINSDGKLLLSNSSKPGTWIHCVPGSLIVIPDISGSNKRVFIDITPKGWETTLYLNGEIYSESHRATITGAEYIKGDFYDNENIDNGLCETLTSFAQYDIMVRLDEQT